MSKIAVFMSGGVDSSLSAVLLKEQGHDITGVTASLIPCDTVTSDRSCCNINNIRDAKDIALKYGFSHMTIDLKSEFKKYVIDDLYENYINGRTPNPCTRCNEFVKVAALHKKAVDMGFLFFATGHYSKLLQDPETERFFLRANFEDPKDQSYFLFPLHQSTLSAMKLPLSGLNKENVRQLAREKDLIVKDKKESQEICFVPDNDYRKFIIENYDIKPQKGSMLDLSGREIGKHDGIWNFTIGQRKGLGINSNDPLYVIKIDSQRNSVTVGSEENLYRKEFDVSNINFMKSTEVPENKSLLVKIRSTSTPLRCTISQKSDLRIKVYLDTPGRAITPGQAAVFYNTEGDLLFGGWI